MRKDLMKVADGTVNSMEVDTHAVKSVSEIKFLKYLYNYAEESVNDFLNEDAYGGDTDACYPLYDIEDMLRTRISKLEKHAKN